MKKKSFPIVNIGIVPVFTIFIILCMVTFALLSYMSANRDYSYSTQVADHTTAYYAAVDSANSQIASIDAALLDSWEKGVYDKTDSTYAFSVPVSDTQEIVVRLERLEQPAKDGTCTRIQAFEEKSTQEWAGDDSLNLMK